RCDHPHHPLCAAEVSLAEPTRKELFLTAFTIETYLRDGEFFSSMAGDVRAGLAASPKSLPPKYFYDDEGCRLFEAITRLPEYYPTRAEAALLRRHAPKLM